jgi:hypothetical protein
MDEIRHTSCEINQVPWLCTLQASCNHTLQLHIGVWCFLEHTILNNKTKYLWRRHTTRLSDGYTPLCLSGNKPATRARISDLLSLRRTYTVISPRQIPSVPHSPDDASSYAFQSGTAWITVFREAVTSSARQKLRCNLQNPTPITRNPTYFCPESDQGSSHPYILPCSISFLYYPHLNISVQSGVVFTFYLQRDLGARGGAVGLDTAIQAGRSRFRFPMVSWTWGWFSL